MKQLTIFCSADLDDRVVTTLDRSGIDGFLCVDHASGSKFNAPGRVPRTMSWDARLFIVPGAEDAQVAQVVDELEGYANACDIQPCLRIVVSTVDRVV